MSEQTIDTIINEQSEQITPYMPEVFRRLAYVYGIPFSLVLIAATIGGILLSSFIPVSTTNIIIFALNIFILVRVWRWAENRWKATALFVMYSRFSRARRDLKSLAPSSSSVDAKLQQFHATADAFMTLIHDFNVQPYAEKNS